MNMSPLQTGDTAPAFDALDQDSKKVSLGDFKGQKLFVFFYPKANTSG
jgi:peroxiredoxin Q/BCP